MASEPPRRSTPIPIVCSLDSAQVPGRLDEWRAVLARVTGREVIDGGLRLVLSPDADLGQIARLMVAEQECCRFFSFALTVDERGTALEVTAPPDGADVLALAFGDR